MEQWNILDREGNPMKEAELPERPLDARLEEGEAFRPWYKQDEHLHIENGRIEGIHARGALEFIQNRLRAYLSREEEIIRAFGGEEDILLPTVDSFLDKK